MVTKIFVSQIDKTNADGTNAAEGSYIKLVDGAAVWASDNVQTGETGFQGSQGFTGSAGTVGYIGSVGEAGLKGPMGKVGYEGSAGARGTGYNGSIGGVGFIGSFGDTGFGGSIGSVGFQGSLGYSGVTGSVGFYGSVGESGFIGSAGNVGFQGSAGGAAVGESVPVPFTYVTDLSPNTYTGKANFLVAVNGTADGVTLIDGNVYITTNTVNQDINFAPYPAPQKFINYPKLNSFSEKFFQYTITGNDIVLDSTNGSIHKLTLAPINGNVITITLPTQSQYWHNQHYSIVLYLKQDNVGGRLIDWSLNNIKWAVGSGIPSSGPILSITPNYTDIFTFTTMNNGASWYGFYSAKGFNVP